MELTCLLAVSSIVLGATISLYNRLCDAVAARGVELSTFGHVKAFLIAGLFVVAGLVALGLVLGMVCWMISALWPGGKLRQRLSRNATE
jgi:hypothetical protein